MQPHNGDQIAALNLRPQTSVCATNSNTSVCELVTINFEEWVDKKHLGLGTETETVHRMVFTGKRTSKLRYFPLPPNHYRVYQRTLLGKNGMSHTDPSRPLKHLAVFNLYTYQRI